jgi:predicted ABC-class ATPase
MGIPAGVTLIVGGGFHGKSTVLRALSLGVYNHIPGDGRERVVMDETAVKIRAEDGRNVCAVDLSAFINNLPGGKSTVAFSTNNASGSTSQAANLLEAVEAGASVLLMDEDSCATNFLVRDARMQALIKREPITPLVDRVVSLYEDCGVSTVLVMGGCGDYLDGASLVIGLEDFRVVDLTDAARDMVKRWPSGRQAAGGMVVSGAQRRLAWEFDAEGDRVKVQGCEMLRLGHEGEIDLAAVEQLVEPGQLRAIAEMLVELGDGQPRTVTEIRIWLERNNRLGQDGVAVRSLEVLAAVNRWRWLVGDRS